MIAGIVLPPFRKGTGTVSKVLGKKAFFVFCGTVTRKSLKVCFHSFRESMAKVHVCNVIVLDNPSPFLNPFQFEITFECIEVRDGAERSRNVGSNGGN